MCNFVMSFLIRKPHRISTIFKETQRLSSTSTQLLSDNGIFNAPIWLRHHCRCEKCFNYATHQRVAIPSLLKELSTVKSFVKTSKADSKGFNCEIVWNDNHVSNYDSEWLEQWGHFQNGSQNHSRLEGHQETKEANEKGNKNLDTEKTQVDIENASVAYKDFMNSDDGVRQLLRNLQTYGYGIVSNTPADLESTKKVVRRVSHPHSTLFGDFYEFQSDSSYADTAYTSDYIHLHTDTTYFTESIGLQIFHCLEHNGEGGLNSIVDGFKVAQQIQNENPEHYEILKKTIVPWQYVDTGKHHFHSLAPIFKHHPLTGELECIRYNPHDMAVLNTIKENEIPKFYDALIHLSNKIEASPARFKLKPGMTIFLDNWRLLHGRDSFTGFRKMCGAYISRSDWMSRCRVLLQRSMPTILLF